MRSRFFYAFIVALCLLTAERNARATTTAVNCNASPTTALGTALNAASNGDVLEITGICTPSGIAVTIPANLSNLTITNHANSSAVVYGDGIEGPLQIVGPQSVLINGINLQGDINSNWPSLVSVSNGATATIQFSQILDANGIGLWVYHGIAHLLGTSVAGNGIANVAGESDGIRVDGGTVDTTGGSINTNNGNGVSVYSGGRFTAYQGSIEENSGGGILVAGGSTALLNGTTVEQTVTPSLPVAFAAKVIGASTLLAAAIINGETVAGGVFVGSGSSLILNASTVESTSASAPALEVTGSSNAILAGDNTISNAAGAAVQVDHSSSVQHENIVGMLSALANGGLLNFTGGPETITGAGVVQEQSSMDLGQGLISGNPSISWTTGSNGIQVQQNSSFRVSGGVSITGAVTITQGSNGFANTANGGTNAITSASCPFTSVPSSHWASPAKVTPTVPSASSYGSATSPQCLTF